MAGGNAVVAAAENENATSLLAHRRRERSHSGGDCGHQKKSLNPTQEREITSVNERQADAAARRCCDGADLLSKNEKTAPLKKTSPRLGSSPS